jgi:protein involved in polysaccharide export with SLBB domain
MRAIRGAVAAVFGWAVLGCQAGGPPPAPPGVAVSGKVFLPGGAPLTGGTLVLRAVGGIHGATAQVQKDGAFELADGTGARAVVPGKYQVFVRVADSTDKALKAAVPARYQNSEDSDSDVTVEIAAATSDLVIRLKR